MNMVRTDGSGFVVLLASPIKADSPDGVTAVSGCLVNPRG